MTRQTATTRAGFNNLSTLQNPDVSHDANRMIKLEKQKRRIIKTEKKEKMTKVIYG